MGYVLYTCGPVNERRRITLPETMPPEIREIKAVIEKASKPEDIQYVIETIARTSTLADGTLYVSGVGTPSREGEARFGPFTTVTPNTADIETIPTLVKERVLEYKTVDVTETRPGYKVPIPEEYIELLASEKEHPAKPWHHCRLYIWPGTADLGVPWNISERKVYLFDAPVADPPEVWFNPAYLTEDARPYIKTADIDAWQRALEQTTSG